MRRPTIALPILLLPLAATLADAALPLTGFRALEAKDQTPNVCAATGGAMR